MCGIAGIISPDVQNVNKQRLQKMTSAIQHRGPDDEAFWVNAEQTTGFGHRRLSIIDLTAAGSQPMLYLGRYTITYNGEIYNYVELKDELVKKGYGFTTNCDTEVVLAAYACYAQNCLQHFDGMFAFAVWDQQEKTLFCARDRFGEKPFYYTLQNEEFIFASEMKALQAAGIIKKMDNEMLVNYLTLGWVQNPVNKQQTFYEDINSLPPAHFLLYKFKREKESSLEIKSYWDIDKETRITDKTEETAKEHFVELFTRSIKRRLRSDVAIGSSLSGGLDSSSIAAIVNKLLNSDGQYQSFSAIFPGFEKNESKQIGEIVDQFNLKNYQVAPTSNDFISDLEKLIYHQEEPFQSASIYAQFKVYELAKQHNVTVILDGQGCDEILAGYPKYYHWFWQEKISRLKWKEAWNEINAARRNDQNIKWDLRNYFSAFLPGFTANQLERNAYKKQSDNAELTFDFFLHNHNKTTIFKPSVNKLNDLLYFNTMHFGLEELLRYADRNSMAHSREVRLPFLNHELVQFIFSLPSSFKIKNGFTKFLLRISVNEFLPKSIVWRKDKVGFEPPQKQWMQDSKVEECIQESRRKLVQLGILKQEVLQKKIRHQPAHEDDNYDWRYLCAAQCM